MKVKEMIELLECFEDDLEVRFQYDYGDHCHRQVAASCREIELGEIKHDSYIDGMAVVTDDNRRYAKDTKPCVIINHDPH